MASHPIQYQAPLFRELARHCDLHVFFAYRQPPKAQAAAGFGVEFEWDVDLLSGYDHTFLRNVARNPDTASFLGCDTPDIAHEIEHGRFDAFLVMGWHLKCFWQAVRSARRCGVRTMVRGDSQLGTSRGKLKLAAKAVLYPWILRQFDLCLYVGERNREYLAHYGVAPHRLFFSPHCVDTHAFATAAAASDRDAVRVAWGLKPKDRAVLFAGKLVQRKRPRDLVRALSARASGDGKSAVLVFAGDGPERQDLEALARTLNVQTVFLGFCNQTELPAVYRASDLLALPSEASETWGLVVNEAMACGLPCVVSDACGCGPDMIPSAESGAVFRMGDVADLARALTTVLEASLLPEPIFAVAEAHSVAAAAAGIIGAATAPLGSVRHG